MVTQQPMNYTVMPETAGSVNDPQVTSTPHSMYNNSAKRHGPIRAAHLTISQEPNKSQSPNVVGNKKMSAGLPTHV